MKTLKLNNYKTFKGHEGMQGFNCTISYKGKNIATAYDDARGGEYEYTILGAIDSGDRAENILLFRELEEKIKKLPTIPFQGLDLDQNLDMIIDDLCKKLDQKKDENKGILVENEFGYEIIGFGVTIPTAIKKYKNAFSALQGIYDEQSKKGKTILNKDYLKTQGIKI